ncbi:MAG: hypothetical protein NVSMB27_40280 [Ktedonobacteraceae bacterium]
MQKSGIIIEKGNIAIFDFGHIQYFLPNGIFIIEGLYGLSKVPSTFYLIALPLKIKSGSGSPLRPVALFNKA